MRIGVRVWIGVALLAGAAGCGRRASEPSSSSRTDRDLTPPPLAAAPLQYHALVMGISDYGRNSSTPEWQRLATARPDAEALAAILADRYGFDVRLLLDRQATREAIIAGLDEVMASGSNSAVLVYFAGHGYYDDALSEGYWIPSDARKQAGNRLAKEDWVWNSTVSKIVSASPVRHVLVVADSCYAGSLFRGEESVPRNPSLRWYQRALSVPSRYLLTSGDMEPVLDSGMQHSVFAQEILNYLSFNESDVFSASELGLAVRTRVARLTGQMARMGPMAVASHAGGEFVFVRQAGSMHAAASPDGAVLEIGATKPGHSAPPAVYRSASASPSADASGSGAGLLAELGRRYGERSEPVEVASKYLDAQRRMQKDVEFQGLVDRLRGRGKRAGAGNGDVVRPRILACLGPVAGADDRDSESRAFLYRIRLQNQLEKLGGVIVVERETLASVLKEMDVGSSEFADSRAATSVGKLLPAGLLLVGEVAAGSGGDQVYLRVVDTETSRVLGSVLRDVPASANLSDACSSMAAEILGIVQRTKPLFMKVVSLDGDVIRIAAGTFQGLDTAASYELVACAAGNPSAVRAPAEENLGTARVVSMDENSSQLRADLKSGGRVPAGQSLWIREIPRQP